LISAITAQACAVLAADRVGETTCGQLRVSEFADPRQRTLGATRGHFLGLARQDGVEDAAHARLGLP
jgi:hypothetical protein